jgi:hypothetical protein
MFVSPKEERQIKKEIDAVLIKHNVKIGQALLILYDMTRKIDLVKPSEFRCLKCSHISKKKFTYNQIMKKYFPRDTKKKLDCPDGWIDNRKNRKW